VKPSLARHLEVTSSVDLHAFVDDFAELLNLIKSLSILLFKLFDNFERPVLLAEDPVVALAIDSLHLKEVVGPPRALNMERDHTLWVLALDACSAILAPAYDALQAEALRVNFRHAHWSLGSDNWSRNPHSTAEMNPLV
jgi:hypothetical protein